jgi:hypothetical protein
MYIHDTDQIFTSRTNHKENNLSEMGLVAGGCPHGSFRRTGKARNAVSTTSEGRRRRERGCAKNSEHPASVTTCCNNTSPLTLCRALGMRAAVAARKPGLTGTAAFRRGAAQRGKVGELLLFCGEERRSRGGRCLGARLGEFGCGIFLGAHGRWSSCCFHGKR